MSFEPEKLNFDRCDDEPIHIPEHYDYLFAIDPDSGEIRIHSENATALLRDAASRDNLAGISFYEVIDADASTIEFIRESYRRACRENLRLPLELRFSPDRVKNSELLDYRAVIFNSNGLMVIEIEPASSFKSLAQARQYGKIYATNIAPTFRSITTVGNCQDHQRAHRLRKSCSVSL